MGQRGLPETAAAASASPTWPTRLAAGEPHRASADVALHVLDVMESLLTAAREQASVTISTSCPVPDLVPLGTLGA